MPLENHIKKMIRNNGSMSISSFMKEALYHPKWGYYQQKNPFGRTGDFITAPEISQIFGELLGVWCVSVWRQMGCPQDVALVEIGPGRGTLMKDLLRGTRHIPDFHDAIAVHMVEISQKLKAVQQENLSGAHESITWCDAFSDVPDKPILLVANELFDALPINQYVKKGGKWQERKVVVAGDGGLEFALENMVNMPETLEKEAHDRDFFEICPDSLELVGQILAVIKKNGGAALIIDYGYDYYGYKDTLQAVKNHKYSDILEGVGQSDITAHVDFVGMKKFALQNGGGVQGIFTQSDFLQGLGIEIRAAKLMQNANNLQKGGIKLAVDRLINPDKMGNLFKVMILESFKL